MDNVIIGKIEEYSDLLDRKDELAELTKENNKKIEESRNQLADMMINDETPQVTHSGFSYTLTPKTKYSKKAGKDDELFDILREHDLGDIIKETVNAATLSATVREMVEDNDDEMPEEFIDVINVYEYNDITRRKSKK